MIWCFARGNFLKKENPDKTIQIFVPVSEYKLYYAFGIILLLELTFTAKKFFVSLQPYL